MKLTIKKGTASKIAHIFVLDGSKSDGSGLTGLVYNTASLTAYYIRPGTASATVISLVTATIGTFASGGFKEIDATNLPGIYEIGIPNACLAVGAESCTIMFKGAANMATLPIEIQLETNTNASVEENAIAVWDEILTGATHNITNSAGKQVRQVGAFAIHDGIAQAGDGHSITLAATASPSDAAYHGIYNRNLIVLTDNTGVGQTRTIVDYDAITKVVVLDRDWRISPDATTAYQIVPDDTPLTVDHGVARGGTATTITIREYASDVDDAYLCNIITIIAGTGRGQARLVGSYDGTNRIATICGDDWVTIPDTTSIYVMMPYGTTCTSCIGDDALAQINTEVVDVLKTDTIAEPAQGAPPATPTFEEALMYVYFKLRNKSETTATEDALYDDAGTTKLMKAAVSDNGTTFTKAEYVSGV
jgi:hypothetical protein